MVLILLTITQHNLDHRRDANAIGSSAQVAVLGEIMKLSVPHCVLEFLKGRAHSQRHRVRVSMALGKVRGHWAGLEVEGDHAEEAADVLTDDLTHLESSLNGHAASTHHHVVGLSGLKDLPDLRDDGVDVDGAAYADLKYTVLFHASASLSAFKLPLIFGLEVLISRCSY